MFKQISEHFVIRMLGLYASQCLIQFFLVKFILINKEAILKLYDFNFSFLITNRIYIIWYLVTMCMGILLVTHYF